MKKILSLIILLGLSCGMGFAADKYSEDYLKNHKHIAIMNPIAEGIVEHSIKSALKKETKSNFKVKFSGYTLSSMKKGIFKELELTGKDVQVDEITIPYVHLKSLSDYNYVDYTKNPIVFKSDMTYSYDMLLSDASLNKVLEHGNYKAVINNINNLAYPMFQFKSVKTKILDNKFYILTSYNFPIAPSPKDKVFVASSDFEVKNGKIKAVNVKLDSAYGKVSLSKVANMLNLLNPLEFTMQLLESKECRANIENVKIVDNNVRIDGKIFVKGE